MVKFNIFTNGCNIDSLLNVHRLKKCPPLIKKGCKFLACWCNIHKHASLIKKFAPCYISQQLLWPTQRGLWNYLTKFHQAFSASSVLLLIRKGDLVGGCHNNKTRQLLSMKNICKTFGLLDVNKFWTLGFMWFLDGSTFVTFCHFLQVDCFYQLQNLESTKQLIQSIDRIIFPHNEFI